MKAYTYTFFALIVTATSAVPLGRRHPTDDSKIDDFTVLNYALTLEHLENAFYTEGLGKFNEQAFIDAGLTADDHKRLTEVGDHESTHVQFLSEALGDQATAPCIYSFPFTDPKSFSALSQVLEGVGVSAYIGASGFIKNKDFLQAAASILATEARHASYIAGAINGGAPFSGPFDTPLNFDEVITLASQFITECPSTNPVLPFKPFPALTLGEGGPGATVSITSTAFGDCPEADFKAVVLQGLSSTEVEISNGTIVIPDDVEGQVYVTLVKDKHVVAGPAILVVDA